MTRYTSGPWAASEQYRQLGQAVWFVTANNAPEGQRLPAECSGPNAAANARLVAAAPELLEAVLDCITQLINFTKDDCGHTDHLVIDAITQGRAAVAKAEGEPEP